MKPIISDKIVAGLADNAGPSVRGMRRRVRENRASSRWYKRTTGNAYYVAMYEAVALELERRIAAAEAAKKLDADELCDFCLERRPHPVHLVA